MEWKVFYGANFWGHSGRDHAGKEMKINKIFCWDGEEWQIPSVYACGKGLVADFLRKVSIQELQQFTDRWQLGENSCYTDFTLEQQMQIEAENPLECKILPTAVLNGIVLKFQQGCGITFHPLLQGPDLEMQGVMAHYALEQTCGWVVWRACFPWKTKRKPKIRTLSFTLAKERTAIPGPRFTAGSSGTGISFRHPVTGMEHTLTVQSLEEYERPWNSQLEQGMKFPSYGMFMMYTVSPELPQGAIQVQDVAQWDEPVSVCVLQDENLQGQTSTEMETTVIGRADGPAAIVLTSPGQDEIHMAYSSMYFEKRKRIDWLVSFHEKLREDISVDLITET